MYVNKLHACTSCHLHKSSFCKFLKGGEKGLTAAAAGGSKAILKNQVGMKNRGTIIGESGRYRGSPVSTISISTIPDLTQIRNRAK